MEKITALYSRCSTEDQAANGISIDSQIKICADEAKKLGCNNIKVVKDEGKSAGNMDRPGLKEIMKLCEEKKVERIIMLSSDRLSRNMSHHIYLRDFFKTHGVTIHYTSQTNVDLNTATGIMVDNTLANMSEFQRLQTADKTRGCLMQKVKEGRFPGVAPLGYRNVDNPYYRQGEISKRIIEPDPETAPLIKEMFRLYSTGLYSLEALAEMMAKKGLRSRRGKMIHHHKLPETLRNRIYVGEINWGGVRIEKAKHQPLIAKRLFERVQKVAIQRNRGAERKRKYKFLLRGLVRCSKCGRRLCAEWHTKPSGLRFGYYHCANACPNTYVAVSTLEKQVSEKFKTLSFSESFIKLVVNKVQKIFTERSDKIASKKKGLLNKKMALEQKRDTVEDKLFKGVINDNDFTRIRQAIKSELDLIEKGISELDNGREIHLDIAQQAILLSRNIHQAYSKADNELKRCYINLFWKKFELKNRKLSVSEPSKLFKALIKGGAGIISLQMGDQRDSNP